MERSIQVSRMFLLLIIAGSCIVFAQESTNWYVSADVANIRKKPVADAPIIGRLKVGNCFTTNKTEKEWVYIDSIKIDYRSFMVNGWVHTSTLIDTLVDSVFIDKKIKESKTFADTIKWLERRVALLPDNKLYLAALQKGYLALSDTAHADEIGRRIQGTEPIYIATRRGDKVQLCGCIDSNGHFESFQWKQFVNDKDRAKYAIDENDELSKTAKKKATSLRVALAGRLWYGNELHLNRRGRRGCSEPLQFPTPFVDPPETLKSYDSLNNTDYQFYDFGGILYSIVLGAHQSFTEYGYFFATKPFYSVFPSGIMDKTEYDSIPWLIKKLVGAAFDINGVTDVHYGSLKEYGYIDIGFRGRNSAGVLGQQRGIFNAKRQIVWPPENFSFYYTDFEKSFTETLSTEWFRFGPDANYPAFTITPFIAGFSYNDFDWHNDGADWGLHLIRISKTDAKTFTINSDNGGD